tara:strand:- start:646 stop:831 length:186 start_codon:yes stop_codon:yes gene_type:complete
MDNYYTSMNEGSKPINIPKKMPTESEYNIKQNFFNPNKNSPPNFFTKKLEARLNKYYKKFS